VFLKALTIKGFKSFAEPANLELEPGITVVVGPNGSGKSNVVDAMAWVLGAQAPSAVRSQKMDDVIFAGTSKKQALGRAEVSLTIDNSDGELAIDFTEVTITRVLFRSGDSQYSINGVDCRLLDIQELLSDSGVGKQQHIIVSQGRIDSVLNARPEDRRTIIEEAAGVLKFRKRKERAERRLESTGDDLNRLQDLSREVGRQIRPLAKQAEAARRHDGLVTELNLLKAHLAGRQLKSLKSEIETNLGNKKNLKERESIVTTELAKLDQLVFEGEAELNSLGASDVAELLGDVSSLVERVRGQRNVINERKQRLEGELESAVDEGLVASLEAEASRITAELALASAELDSFQPEFQELEISEAALSNKQLSFDAEWGDGLDPTPVRATELRAQIEALTAASKRSESELERITSQVERLEARKVKATETLSKAEQDFKDAELRLPNIEQGLVQKVTASEELESAVESQIEKRRLADTQVSHWVARQDALSQAIDDARSEAGAEALQEVPGVLGILLELVEIEDGWDQAVEAALGGALQSIVIEGSDEAANALKILSDKDIAGSVAVLNSGALWPANRPESALRSKVSSANSEINTLLDVMLQEVEVVDGSWRDGFDKAVNSPTKIFVTKAGDRFAPGRWKLTNGGASATGAALQEANYKVDDVRSVADAAAEVLKVSQAQLIDMRNVRRGLETELQEVSKRKGQASQSLEYAKAELEQCENSRSGLDEQRSEIFTQKQRDAEILKGLLDELPDVELQESQHFERTEALSSSRSELENQAKSVAEKRTDLVVKSAAIKERSESLTNRQSEIESRLVGLVSKREEAKQRREKIQSSLDYVQSLYETLEAKAEVLAGWKSSLQSERQEQSDSARVVSEKLTADRKSRQSFESELGQSREKLARIDISDAECSVKLETLVDAVRRELEIDPDTAMATDCPELPDGKSPEAQVRELERELKIIGVINPLALEEFEELKIRDEFLKSQLQDIKKARTDLRGLIRSIDEEIMTVFAAAYADVSENFQALFTTLFPGGKGGIKMVNSDDLLNCGLEIEAKPSGKSVKKLSLLSGGERSLVALAFLFAVFRSRPSPFYVMDEVEAALDDMNLSRFLSLVEEFRKEAQLIIVSHQKRTMECADVLYGVSMKPGGSSKVISEKVKDNKDLQQIA